VSETSSFIEQEVEQLLRWYDDNKSRFMSSAYMDRGPLLRRFFFPFAHWDSAEVLHKEIIFNLKAVSILAKKLRGKDRQTTKRSLSLLLLCLKNRAEYASNGADFYPVQATLLIFVVSVVGQQVPQQFRFWLLLGAIGLVAAAMGNRLLTRRKVADTRELINIIELYKEDLLEADRENT
jgi:hypothetical protein